MIVKLDDELPCAVSNGKAFTQSLLGITFVLILLAIVLMNVYVIVVHLMFKQLRTTIGKLLMLNNLFIALMTTGFLLKIMLLASQTGRWLIACHCLTLSLILFSVGFQTAATCILHSFAYILYRSSMLQCVSKGETKSLYRWYITFIFGAILLNSFLAISYDIGVNQGAHIFPSGDCVTGGNLVNNVVSITHGILKSIQIVLFLLQIPAE